MKDGVLIDGAPAEVGWLRERAWQFGDGLFETIAVIDSNPCLWALHAERLVLGCGRLNLSVPDTDLLLAELRMLCAGRARSVAKLYWTAGRSARGYVRPIPVTPCRVLHVTDWRQRELTGWRVRLCDHRLSEQPQLAQIKHLNRLDQVVARAEWDDTTVAEGLMLDQDGYVVCGTMSNLFLQSRDVLFTPSIERCGVAGVVRRLVIELGEQAGSPVREARVSLGDLRAADAAYLTNSLIGVVRIAHCDSIDFDLTCDEHPLLTNARRTCHLPGQNGAVL